MIFAVLLLLAGNDAGKLSPAEYAMADARRAIAAAPSRPDGYNALGMALARRARETADGSYYEQASEAMKKSLELAPDNFEARKLEIWLMLGKHEFHSALQKANDLKRRASSDPMVYGMIADACAELGKYPEAEEAAQWMLDLGRSSVPGLTRAAYLREIFGDIDGAAELMVSAYDKLDPALAEDRAWVLTHLAHLRLVKGQLEPADRLLAEALRQFPRYHYTYFHLAKLRSMQGRHAEAAELLRERFQAAPHPENQFHLATALKRAGRAGEAAKAFQEFEAAARNESQRDDNANRELIFYYVDYANQPQRALPLALRELSRRRDVYTLDAAAWTLCRNNRHSEAKRKIETALRVGVRDAQILYHAGVIAASQKDDAAARRYFTDSLTLNPYAEVAQAAKTAMAALKSPANHKSRRLNHARPHVPPPFLKLSRERE